MFVDALLPWASGVISTMKNSISLRTQLAASMALLVLLQSLVLVASLFISQVFTMLDAESFRLFGNTVNTRVQAFNTQVGSLVGSMALHTEGLTNAINELAQQSGVDALEIYEQDEVYDVVALLSAQTIISLLEDNSISGAFFALNRSNSDKQNEMAHSAVYIRDSAPGSSVTERQYSLQTGPISVSQEYAITTGVSWDLDIVFDEQTPEIYDFYEKPMSAANEIQNAEIERYGYWSSPESLPGEDQQLIYYTMPLIGEDNVPYGILGVEISLAHFTQVYLPNVDLPYNNSFYAIAAVRNDELLLDWTIPSGPIAQVYLKQGQNLQLEDVRQEGFYSAELEGLGEMYCSTHELRMYSDNSPFVNESWSLVGFVPQDMLHESSSGVGMVVLASIVIITAVCFVAVFLVAYISTRKISGLSKYVSGLAPHRGIHFQKTGMREIDELTSAVERLNESVINASETTSKILEMTLLPIGGFEVKNAEEYVVLTEYVHTLLGIEQTDKLTKGRWAEYLAQLTAEPSQEHENIYKYKQVNSDKQQWLRILQNKTATGTVGVVLDVTRDIEENIRLAQELDHDALTGLYNRTAFKRKAYRRMNKQPDKIGVMIFADLDNLKYINDTFGHDMGDKLIMGAGDMFGAFSAHGGVVARISGDEFAVYLHGFEDKQQAREVIEEQYRKNESVTIITPNGEHQRIRCSSGMAWYPDDSDDVSDLLKLSDFAMYEAKHKEKGTIFEYNEVSYKQSAYILENTEAINRLLDESLIRFAFQPIVCLKTGEIFAYEALMRPLLENFKSPMEILTVAAAQSKLSQLERTVFFTVLKTIDDNVKKFGSSKVFINSIPSQMLSEKDWKTLRRKYKHLFKNLVVEITEVENVTQQEMQHKVEYIQNMGMQIALDDFGSGYSNELRILSINMNIVKIDMGMINGIHDSPDKQKLVSNVVSFCHPKGIQLVAEGVEDEKDLAELVRLDVDYVQGYYTAKPSFDILPISEERKDEILRLNEGASREKQQ